MFRFKDKKNNHPAIWVLCTLVFLASCNGCKNTTPRKFTGNPVPVNLMRFEKDLFAVDTTQKEFGLQALYNKYGFFYLSYARDILAMKEDEKDPLFLKPMSMVVGYAPFRKLAFSIDSSFGELAGLKNELSQAMGIYKTQFPDAGIPAFVTFLSEYGYANVTYDTIIGIGLDMYMNKTHRHFYKTLDFPEYMIKKLRYEYILPNAIKAIAIGKYDDQTYRDKRFLSMMIYEGKIRYFAKALLPEVHDTLIMGCSAKQLQWCYDNEPEMWTHYIDKELLYKNEPTHFIRYFNDGPFTSADGVPAESAPGIGAWTGLRIVSRYMELYPEVTLKQLMEDTDCDKILKLSKYRPEKN